MSEKLTSVVLDDHAGVHYEVILERLHRALRPRTYFEIGVFTGNTLRLAMCNSIAVDPSFKIHESSSIKEILDKEALHLFRMTSDEFFRLNSPTKIFGKPIDFAFLDGMHRCEFLLRDFINTERHCRPNSIIALHDCLPLDPPMASRIMHAEPSASPHRSGWWTGDVWRTALLLRRQRPEIEMTVLDAAPTGLILLTNLNPESTILSSSYYDSVKQMLSIDLSSFGIKALFSELGISSTDMLASDEAITQRFWL